jgi:hypothetical protein
MTYYHGTLTGGTEGVQSAHRQFYNLLKTWLEANSWTTLRFSDFDDTLAQLLPTAVKANGELFVKGVGISGNDEIYIGFKPYYNRVNDYYNYNLGCAIGYWDEYEFYAQPGIKAFSFAGHNLEIEYFVNCNKQRIFGILKVNNNYQHFYVGKYNSYSFPHEYPYPVFINGTAAVSVLSRYSVRTIHPYRNGDYYSNRINDWQTSTTYPFNMAAYQTDGLWLTSAFNVVRCLPTTYDLNTKYTLVPAYMYYGELDGVYWVSGYNLQAEDTITVDTKTYICLPVAASRAIGDYLAFSME